MQLALQLPVLVPEDPPVLLKSLVLTLPLFTLLLCQSQGQLGETRGEKVPKEQTLRERQHIV